MDVVDSIAVDFGARIDHLPRFDPFFVRLLLAYKFLKVVNVLEIVYFECVFGVDFLQGGEEKKGEMLWLEWIGFLDLPFK